MVDSRGRAVRRRGPELQRPRARAPRLRRRESFAFPRRPEPGSSSTAGYRARLPRSASARARTRPTRPGWRGPRRSTRLAGDDRRSARRRSRRRSSGSTISAARGDDRGATDAARTSCDRFSGERSEPRGLDEPRLRSSACFPAASGRRAGCSTDEHGRRCSDRRTASPFPRLYAAGNAAANPLRLRLPRPGGRSGRRSSSARGRAPPRASTRADRGAAARRRARPGGATLARPDRRGVPRPPPDDGGAARGVVPRRTRAARARRPPGRATRDRRAELRRVPRGALRRRAARRRGRHGERPLPRDRARLRLRRRGARRRPHERRARRRGRLRRAHPGGDGRGTLGPGGGHARGELARGVRRPGRARPPRGDGRRRGGRRGCRPRARPRRRDHDVHVRHDRPAQGLPADARGDRPHRARRS